MDVDWTRLIRVRECHKLAALEDVARERRAAHACDNAARQARAEQAQQVVEQTRMWRTTTTQPGGLRVDNLRHASAWSHALDARIAGAGRAVEQAQQQAGKQHVRLDESRGHLRTAVGDLEKAERMQQRARADHERTQESRVEDNAEEAAAQVWAARRSS